MYECVSNQKYLQLSKTQLKHKQGTDYNSLMNLSSDLMLSKKLFVNTMYSCIFFIDFSQLCSMLSN